CPSLQRTCSGPACTPSIVVPSMLLENAVRSLISWPDPTNLPLIVCPVVSLCQPEQATPAEHLALLSPTRTKRPFSGSPHPTQTPRRSGIASTTCLRPLAPHMGHTAQICLPPLPVPGYHGHEGEH